MTVHTSGGMLVKPGDFAAVRMADDVGKLIYLGEILNGDGFRNFEHAITYIGGPDDLILEAMPGGALIVPMRYDASDVLWSTSNPALNLSDALQARVPAVCDKFKGVPYSALDYFALAAHRLFPEPDFPKALKTYIGDSGHEICSQMVDNVRLLLGFHLFRDGRWPGFVTPMDIANRIEA